MERNPAEGNAAVSREGKIARKLRGKGTVRIHFGKEDATKRDRKKRRINFRNGRGKGHHRRVRGVSSIEKRAALPPN